MSKKKPQTDPAANTAAQVPTGPPKCRFCHGAAPPTLFADWDFPVCWKCADYLYSLPPPIAAELYRQYTKFWEENGTDKEFEPVARKADLRRRHGLSPDIYSEYCKKRIPVPPTAAANKKLPPMASAYNVPPLPGEVPVYRIPSAADVDTEALTRPPPMPRGGPRTLAELIIEIKEAREASGVLEILAYSDETRELLWELEAAQRRRAMLCDNGEAVAE